MPGPAANITMVLKVQKLRNRATPVPYREIVKQLQLPENHLRQVLRWAKYDVAKVVDKSLKSSK